MQALKVILRRARTLLWTAISIVIIGAAIIVGIGKLLMPYSQQYQPQLEQWLSQEFGQPVTLQSFTGQWNAFGPRLSLRGMSLANRSDGVAAIAISEAALDLKPLNIFFPGKALYNFLVIGADFRLVHTRSGAFELSGFGVSKPDNESPGNNANSSNDAAWRNLAGIGELILEDSSLHYVDERHQVELYLSDIDARLQLDDESLSLKLQSGLVDQSSGRIFGEVDATALLELGSGTGLEEARWQVKVRDLVMAPLQSVLPGREYLPQQGRVSAELWGDWVSGRPLIVRGAADFRDGLLERSGEQIAIEHINTNFAWQFSGKGDWRVDFDDLLFDDGVSAWTTARFTVARALPINLGLWLSSDYLPLDIPLNLAQKLVAMQDKSWPAALPFEADGDISNFELALDREWNIRRLYGTARNTRLATWGRWPGLDGLDADIEFDQGSGRLELHARRLLVDWPEMFVAPLEFALPACHSDWRWDQNWQVSVTDCSLLNDAIALNGQLVISSNEGRPAVDINVHLPRGQIDQFADLWPVGIMSENAVNWLRKSLVRGTLQNGRLQIVGDMDDWPFRDGSGRFEAVAIVDGAELAYLDAWPRAGDIRATARFVGASMDIEAYIGDTAGAEVQQASARIADFKAPKLIVEYSTTAPLRSVLGFIRQSPLQKTIGTDLSVFRLGGPAAITGRLAVPFGDQPGEVTVSGDIRLKGNTFEDTQSGIQVGAIAGRLVYDRNRLYGADLMGEFKGKPARIQLLAQGQGDERFRVDATGEFTVADMLPDFLQDDLADFPQINGSTTWNVAVIVPAGSPAATPGARVEVRTVMDGLEVDLPQPLNKLPDETWPLVVTYPLSGEQRQLLLELPRKVTFVLDLVPVGDDAASPGAIDRALVRFNDESLELPAPGMIRIGGEVDRLDLDEWVRFLTEQASKSGGLGHLQVEPLDLVVGELIFLDRLYQDVQLEVSLQDESLRAGFAGENIDGQVIFTPDSGTGSLTAEFDRLVVDKPMASGVNMQSDPADLPELHLFAQSFKYAGIELGETRIEAFPRAEGFHFEKVETESEALSLRATGDWSLSQGIQRSDFNITVTSESLGALLNSLEISSSMEGGQSLVHFNAWWPGSPAAFALSRLNGELDFSVSRGQISNASAGSGRLLGLLSIQALPRRLSLDFRDVFDSGFDFEEAGGTFRMQNGTATTDDLELTSSAASISLTGSTDLVGQQYDQVMTIKPGVGNTLPVLGALAGGPGGAAAGLALQGLLHKQLGEATQVRYTITGSWDEPVIEPVLKEGGDETGADDANPVPPSQNAIVEQPDMGESPG